MAGCEEAELEDLLSGSEDEQPLEDAALLGVGDMEVPEAAAPIPTMMEIDALASYDTKDSDSEEDEVVKNEKEQKRLEEVARRRKAMYDLLNIVAPGIDLFNGAKQVGASGRPSSGFLYFSPATLRLEADFGYSRRARLLGHGFTNDELDTILTDPFELVRHLMPEAQTVLICDKEDFKAVMNFLLYSISVCSDHKLNSLLMKAFFDLRRNYGFSWSLSLKHVLTVLLNYGADENVIFNEDFFNDDKVGIKKHLEEVQRSGQPVPSKYSLPHFSAFFKKRRKGNVRESFVKMADDDFDFCVARFLLLLADFSAGLQSYQEFKTKNNLSDQLVFLYTVLLVGTDRRFISDLATMENVMTIVHFHLDSFSSALWRWGPTKKADSASSKSIGFNHASVCKTLVRMVNEFFPAEGGRQGVVCWEAAPSGRKVTDDTGCSDHHLNMLHRIHLVPPSFRGNQVRKYLAYLYLQTLACIPYSLPYTVEVEDLLENKQLYYDPEKEKETDLKFCEGLKLIVLSKNYEMVMTLVELYDIIVGHEPEVDFTPEKAPLVEKLRRGVLEWVSALHCTAMHCTALQVRRKCPGLHGQRGLDEETVRRMQLAEYLDIVEGRWQTLIGAK
jgi:hypothetical protein